MFPTYGSRSAWRAAVASAVLGIGAAGLAAAAAGPDKLPVAVLRPAAGGPVLPAGEPGVTLRSYTLAELRQILTTAQGAGTSAPASSGTGTSATGASSGTGTSATGASSGTGTSATGTTTSTPAFGTPFTLMPRQPFDYNRGYLQVNGPCQFDPWANWIQVEPNSKGWVGITLRNLLPNHRYIVDFRIQTPAGSGGNPQGLAGDPAKAPHFEVHLDGSAASTVAITGGVQHITSVFTATPAMSGTNGKAMVWITLIAPGAWWRVFGVDVTPA